MAPGPAPPPAIRTARRFPSTRGPPRLRFALPYSVRPTLETNDARLAQSRAYAVRFALAVMLSGCPSTGAGQPIPAVIGPGRLHGPDVSRPPASGRCRLGRSSGSTSGAEFDLRQRGNLLDLDRQLHAHWGLGRNLVLAWCPYESGLLLLVVPHYAIADYSVASERASTGFRLRTSRTSSPICSPAPARFSDAPDQQRGAPAWNANLVTWPCGSRYSDQTQETRLIDRMVKRYGVSYVPAAPSHCSTLSVLACCDHSSR